MEEQIYGPKIFIGREKEIELFEQMLDETKDTKWILNIYGKGGIGKTRLLHRFIEIIENRNKKGQNILVTKKLIDFYWTSYQRELSILKEIANQLDKNQFTEFYEALEQFDKLLAQPVLPVAYLLREASTKVKDYFFSSYERLKGDRIILLFDTAELASNSVKRFWEEILPLFREKNDKTLIVIAGREQLHTSFQPESLQLLEVSGFSTEEVRAYFEERKVLIRPDILKKVTKLSQGRPILVALTIDWINFGFSPHDLIKYQGDQFEQAMVERVQQLHYPEDHAILAMAHIYRRFNEEILAYILDLQDQEAARLVKTLARFSFVKYREPAPNQLGSCLLHDEMRLLINKYVWTAFDPNGSYRRDWNQKIIKYYASKIEKESDIIEIQHLSQERLFYWIYYDIEQAFKYSHDLFNNAMDRYDADFMEAINTEISQVQNKLTPAMQRELKFRQAVLSHRHEKYDKAISEMIELIDDPACEPILKASAISRLVEFYADSGNTVQAIKYGQDGEQIIEKIQNQRQLNEIQRKRIELDFGILCNNLGYAYRSQGKNDLTVKYYNKALEHFAAADGAYAHIARAKNNLGYVYHRLGRDAEALAECDAALKIRQRLKIPYELGLSYNVLGMIYVDQLRVEEAEKYFKLALESFKEANNERGRAMVYVAYGRLMRQWGWYKEKWVGELADPNRKEYVEASRMLDEAIKIFRNFNDLPNLSEALNEKGTLFRQQRLFNEAIKCYEDSVKLAERIGNRYRQADYLEDIAITHEFSDNPDYEIALKYAKQSSDIAQEIRAYYLFARAQRSVANILFARGDYTLAFEAAGNACVNILRLDPDRLGPSPAKRKLLYEEWVDWIIDKLSKLPTFDLVKKMTEYLIKRWEQEEWGGSRLADMYPDFIKTLDDRLRYYKFLIKT